jgi:gamma-glutamyl-gamma-aminobutyrate hydrolase PuuD/uncharacterized protein YjbI with pentapeptide repeats
VFIVIHNNIKLLDQFLNLDIRKRKLLIKKLSSCERKIILNIIKENGDAFITEQAFNNISQKFNKIKDLNLKNTRKNIKTSSIAKLSMKVSCLVADIGYLFHYLTSDKALRLITKELLKQHPSSDIPQISEKKLTELLMESNKNDEKIHIAEILKSNGFSTEIKGVIFSEKLSLNHTNLSGITFTDCSFEWTQCNNSCLCDVTFKNCNIYNLSLVNSELKCCHFIECDMREVMFTAANLEDIIFDKSSLTSSSFEDSSLIRCIFKTTSMPATHFLEAKVNDSHIFNSDLKDTVFFGTNDQFNVDDQTKKTAVITRPITAMLINPEMCGRSTPKLFMKIDQSAEVIGLRITMEPQKTTKEGVNDEVEAALKSIGPQMQNQSPLPQRLINELAQNPYSESAKILKKTEILAAHVNSFLLPGGDDVIPALYGQEKQENTICDDNYRRSILELGIIHQSFKKGIPLMGICRGFQITNVYFGAQLIQHVDGQIGVQKIKLNTPETGLYSGIMKHSIITAVFHHQAVPEKNAATEHLEAVINVQGLVKGVEVKDSGAAPMILLQFHPEFYKAKTASSNLDELKDVCMNILMSDKNELFWKILSDSARTHYNKLAAIQQIPKKSAINILKIDEIEKRRADIFEVYKKNFI